MQIFNATLAANVPMTRFRDDRREYIAPGATGTAHPLDLDGMADLYHLNIIDAAGELWTGHAPAIAVDLGDLVTH